MLAQYLKTSADGKAIYTRRTLVASLPELADGLAPLRRALSGSVLRPCCHFELPTSTYLAQGQPLFTWNVHAIT